MIPSFLEIDVDEAPVAEAELDEWLAPVESRPFMLFVGALRLEKGVQQLFDAYAGLERAPALVLMGTREVDTPGVRPAGAVIIEKVLRPASSWRPGVGASSAYCPRSYRDRSAAWCTRG